MTALFLTRPHYQISLQQGLLRIRHPDEGHRLVPWHGLQRLVVGPGVSLDSDVILKLAEKQVELLALGQRHAASLHNPQVPHDQRRLQQYAVTCDPACRFRLAQRIIYTRVAQQQTLLRHYALSMPACPQRATTTQQLMLEEAHHSQHYWQQWRSLLADFGFHGRQRRPPRDPANALLSLVATLEEGLLTRALLGEGLDTGLGLLHSTGYRRQSLVLDVMELTRTTQEQWAFQLLLHGTLTPAHFQQDKESGCRLTPAGQRLFYPAWHRFAKQRQPALQRLARLCRRIIEREARHAAITLVD